MLRIRRKTNAEDMTRGLLARVDAARRFEDKTYEQLTELQVRYESSVCYKIREIIALEHPLWYTELRKEIQKKAKEKIYLKA